MTKSRWLSLLIVIPYVLSVVFSPIWRNPWDGGSWMYLRCGVASHSLPFVVGFVCVWWPDIPVWLQRDQSDPLWASEDVIVALGWGLLVLAVIMRIVFMYRSGY